MEEEDLQQQEPATAEPVDPAEQPADSAPADPQTPAEPAAEPEPPKENKVQKRIDEITRARRHAEQEADYWRRVAKGEIQQQPQTPAQPEAIPGLPPKPSFDQFDDYDAYVEALGEWSAEKTLLARDHKQRQAAAQKERDGVVNSHLDRVDAVRGTKYADWDDVVADASHVRFNDGTLAAILESDQSADISYHLMKNDAEYQRIIGLSPLQQIKEIARLEDKFKAAPPPKRITQAPTPLNPLGGGTDANLQKDPDKMSDEEWLAWDRARLAKLGRRY